MGTTRETPHSADVKIHLYVNGYVLPVAQLGPDFLVLRKSVEQPPCEAEIAMSIDGQESRWKVHLLNGIQVGRRETTISSCADCTRETLARSFRKVD
jgi:hypothetical protein